MAPEDTGARPRLARIVGVLAGYFARRPDVVCAYLFGSQATGTACAASDVDVAVLLDPPPDGSLGPMVEMEERLRAALPAVRVDVVILNDAGLRLRHEVVCTGRLAFERDLGERVDFEVRTAMLYFDWQPIERRFDDAAVTWARGEEGT